MKGIRFYQIRRRWWRWQRRSRTLLTRRIRHRQPYTLLTIDVMNAILKDLGLPLAKADEPAGPHLRGALTELGLPQPETNTTLTTDLINQMIDETNKRKRSRR